MVRTVEGVCLLPCHPVHPAHLHVRNMAFPECDRIHPAFAMAFFIFYFFLLSPVDIAYFVRASVVVKDHQRSHYKHGQLMENYVNM